MAMIEICCKTLSGSISMTNSAVVGVSPTRLMMTVPGQVDKDAAFYTSLSKLVLTDKQLVDNGYPRWEGDGRVTVKDVSKNMYSPAQQEPGGLTANERLCHRCNAVFAVDSEGVVKRVQQCVYHAKGITRKGGHPHHKCCNAREGSRGCETAPVHVHRINLQGDLTGYVRTLPSTTAASATSNGNNSGIYAVDCEMIYTTFGMELAQVTVVGVDSRSVLTKLIKPDHSVVDWHTQFSGITEAMMSDITTTLSDIQQELLQLFNERTILIGHSLDSDLVALKMVHGNVVDTSLHFGLFKGYKRALKEIVGNKLGRTIQTGVRGHDSTEDATACMDLMKQVCRVR